VPQDESARKTGAWNQRARLTNRQLKALVCRLQTTGYESQEPVRQWVPLDSR